LESVQLLHKLHAGIQNYMKSFKLTHIKTGTAGTLYSVQFQGESATELEKFLQSSASILCDDYNLVRRRLAILIEPGKHHEVDDSIDQWFVSVPGGAGRVFELKGFGNGGIRLTCIRRGLCILIAGFTVARKSHFEHAFTDQAVLKRMAEGIDRLMAEAQEAGELLVSGTGVLRGMLEYELAEF
jgi:hypothetical protein